MTLEDPERQPEDPDAVHDGPRRGPDADERDRREPTADEGSMDFPGEDGPEVVGSGPSAADVESVAESPDGMGQSGEP